MWETIRGYLTFTRKERFGVLFLLAVILLLFVLPYFFRPRPGEPDPETYEKIKVELQKFETIHTDSIQNTDDQNRQAGRKQVFISPQNRMLKPRWQPFFFDPNTLKLVGWQQLGLSDHITQTIVHFIDKGGRFHKPEDLKKIYGLHNDDYERLLPYVRISELPKTAGSVSGYYSTNAGAILPRVYKKLEYTEINKADSVQWSRLPGIGFTLASRIVHFREKLGGFYKVDQVGETFGLPDSTFQKIKAVLFVDTIALVLININKASRDSLQSHPYIRWRLANAITEYRKQHGRFRSVDEFMELAVMDSANFLK